MKELTPVSVNSNYKVTNALFSAKTEPMRAYFDSIICSLYHWFNRLEIVSPLRSCVERVSLIFLLKIDVLGNSF